MSPLPTNLTLLQQVIAGFEVLRGCPQHLDHLFIAWAADLRDPGTDLLPASLDEVVAIWNTAPPPSPDLLPYKPMTDDQVQVAANLQRLGLLATDHRPTLLGQAVVAYAQVVSYPFLGVPYPDEEEPAWLAEAIPESI
jgi:hypothetical protein